MSEKRNLPGMSLKKAGPPPIPADAFSRPAASNRPNDPHKPESPMPSPWDDDVVSSAPKPEPVKPSDAGVQAPNWMGRPVLHPDHSEELETHAAVNEFGMKMPRAHAEQAAYDDYVTRQREQAAAHHLAGVKAAHGAGDMEAARKHGMMYAVHAKALGHEPVGPVPASIAAHGSQKVYKFKPHKGDLFALDQKAPEGVVSSAQPPPQLGKSERDALYTIWLGAQAVLAKGDVVKFPGNSKPPEDKGKEADVESMKRWALDRGRVPGKDKGGPKKAETKAYDDGTTDKKPEEWHRKDQATAKLHVNRTNEQFNRNGGYTDAETKHLGPEGQKRVKERNESVRREQRAYVRTIKSGDWAKAELAARKKSVVPCRCTAYSHPHRTGGGKCGAGK